MSQMTLYINALDLLHYAQGIGYDWGFIRNIEEFQNMFPDDYSYVTLTINNYPGRSSTDTVMSLFDHLKNKDFINILASYIASRS